MTRIALVVSDVDGTLLTKDKRLTDAALDTVRRLHLTGIQFYDWAYRHADLLGGGEHELPQDPRERHGPAPVRLLSADWRTVLISIRPLGR